ncbi:Nucleoside diphosphate kinase A [Entophlyctis luteolus]|nr:Nucleoside diphosphate kinase A [Entophlyctis luteolus]
MFARAIRPLAISAAFNGRRTLLTASSVPRLPSVSSKALAVAAFVAAGTGAAVLFGNRDPVENSAAPIKTAAGTKGGVERTFIAVIDSVLYTYNWTLKAIFITQIKPDGVQRGLISEIIGRFERKGFRLVAIKAIVPSKALAEEHYADLKARPFYNGLVNYMTSGRAPVIAMVWEGIDVIKTGRKIIGATNPADAEPGTIRGDFTISVGRNAIHGSDSFESATTEISLWFKAEEVCNWNYTERSARVRVASAPCSVRHVGMLAWWHVACWLALVGWCLAPCRKKEEAARLDTMLQRVATLGLRLGSVPAQAHAHPHACARAHPRPYSASASSSRPRARPNVYSRISAVLESPDYTPDPAVLPPDAVHSLARAAEIARARRKAIEEHRTAVMAQMSPRARKALGPDGMSWPDATRSYLFAVRREMLLRGLSIDSKQHQQEDTPASATADAPAVQPVVVTRKYLHPHAQLLARLRADGGNKISVLRANVLHVLYSRFVPLLSDIRGLSLKDALLTLKWHRKRITRKMVDVMEKAIVKAKEDGLDLDRTFVADAFVKKDGAILSSQFTKRYLRGRGRYGSTQHPVTALVEVTLQERDTPFERREADPLEWVRKRLRDRFDVPGETVESVYRRIAARKVVKEVHC